MELRFFYTCCGLTVIHFIIICHSSSELRKINYEPFTLKNETFFKYLQNWNTSFFQNDIEGNENEKELIDHPPNHISDTNIYFKSSESDPTLILTDVSRCMADYSFFTCVKLLLLNRVTSLTNIIEHSDAYGKDLQLFNGIAVFKWLNNSESAFSVKKSNQVVSSVDGQLTASILRLFESRSLMLTIFPGLAVELTPKAEPDREGFVCFQAKAFVDDNFNSSAVVNEMRQQVEEAKKKKKNKKKGGFNMMPMMIVPQMIMLGFLPFALANLKMMVMNAFMTNTMALNGAIFMTIRNMVFGQKRGPKIKYVNYGYGKGKKNKKPELVLHSPAAFVKGPERHKPPPPQENVYSSDFGYPPLDNHNGFQTQAQPHFKRNTDKRRQTEINKYVQDKIRLRTQLRDVPPEVKKIVAQMSNSNVRRPVKTAEEYPPLNSHQPDYGRNPIQLVTDVDAPNSYLNNNHYLLPSNQYPSSNNNNDYNNEYQYSNDNSNEYDNNAYQAYNDIYLQSKSPSDNQGSGSENEPKNYYSAKYNKEQTKFTNHKESG